MICFEPTENNILSTCCPACPVGSGMLESRKDPRIHNLGPGMQKVHPGRNIPFNTDKSKMCSPAEPCGGGSRDKLEGLQILTLDLTKA
jgi:hypothetical protein